MTKGYRAGVTDARWVPLRTAWDEALYGERGFYRHHQPAEHFRTSPQVSGSFAAAVVSLARRERLVSVCDLGAGAGELLDVIHGIAPDLELTAVEIRARPEVLVEPIRWRQEMPTDQTGLVIANELLDNVPCDVVEQDLDGRIRTVEVDRLTGAQRLGAELGPEQHEWLDTWWPLTRPGQRAEVGLDRDRFWTRICATNPAAVVVCVDYGHRRGDRPFGGSLSAYRGGVQTPLCFDGLHDITAHLAIDSIAAAAGGVIRRQRDVLRELGVDGARPPIEQARRDPAGYVQALSRSTADAELTASGGLGDYYWVLRPQR
jgi:SAM-dependent MidA family methyltransferase